MDETRRRGIVLGILTWVALLAYMSKLGSESTSRLIAAYYPLLLLPMLLNAGQTSLVRRRWYNGLAICAGLIALLAVILTPSRPLWPAKQFFTWATGAFPESELLSRAGKIYTIYRSRNDLFASLRKNIPPSVEKLGLIESDDDDAETSLWRPFGDRRVVHVLQNDRVQDDRLQWVVVKNAVIGHGTADDFQHWMRRNGADLVAQQALTEKAGHGPELWSVVHFGGASN